MYHRQQSQQQYNSNRQQQQQQTVISSSNVISSPSTPTSSICSNSVRSSAFSNASGSMSYPNSPFVEWEEEQRKQLAHAQTLLTQKEVTICLSFVKNKIKIKNIEYHSDLYGILYFYLPMIIIV